MGEGQPRAKTSDIARDVLAAEEFALPAADPSIAHPPVELPDDPSGIAEPHDVLAAEEFALPASHGGPGPVAPGERGAAPLVLLVVAVAVVVLRLWRRRRSA